jgi:uncharacterized protein (DUF2062 family)
MNGAVTTATASVDRQPGSFWQRRVIRPIVAQLTQGVTPDHLALTLAVGSACSLFPFFGFTALLNLGIGVMLRMNQPLLQTLNQLVGPLQIILILVHVRIGEVIWRAQGDHFTFGEMMRVFRAMSFADFLQRFGWAGVHALTSWILISPLLVAGLYFSLRPALRRLAERSATAHNHG